MVYGIHPIQAILASKPDTIKELWVQQGLDNDRVQALVAQAKGFGISIQSVRKSKLTDHCGSNSHQGICARAAMPKLLDEQDLALFLQKNDPRMQDQLWLVMDCVEDPHNLGACLRSAECAGVSGVVMPKDKSLGITPVVRKVSCGAADLLPVFQVTNLSRALTRMQKLGVWVVGMLCDDNAKPLYDLELKGSTALVVGSEGSGLRRLTADLCDYQAFIPLSGHLDSLNVSVATGVALFEVLRQRKVAHI